MNLPLLDIKPRELKFLFEAKKQCSCKIQLVNNAAEYVAFKVKTTSPKKYCVRPNVGIIRPKAAREFTVTMQVQQSAPPDMICKDKFLVQGTVVPSGTTDEDITSSMFVKSNGNYVEEAKLRVSLVSPLHSPVLSPINVPLHQGPAYEATTLKDQDDTVGRFIPHRKVANDVEELKVVTGVKLRPTKEEESTTTKVADLKPKKDSEIYAVMDDELTSTNIAEAKPNKNSELDAARDVEPKAPNVEGSKPEIDTMLNVPVKELKPTVDADSKPALEAELQPTTNPDPKPALEAELQPTINPDPKPAMEAELQPTVEPDPKPAPNVEFKTAENVESLKLGKEIEGMKSKLNQLESKLSEAEVIISNLTEERRITIQEREAIKAELAKLRTKGGVKTVQVGFPLLYVCMVALISAVLGYVLRP